MTSKQWESLFTDDTLDDSDDQQYMNTLWGYVIQKYADISIPHLEHITGIYHPVAFIEPLSFVSFTYHKMC